MPHIFLVKPEKSELGTSHIYNNTPLASHHGAWTMFLTVQKNYYVHCCHMLMSALPMTQFWCEGSSIFIQPPGSLHLGEANQSPHEMKLHWCLQVGLLV